MTYNERYKDTPASGREYFIKQGNRCYIDEFMRRV